MKKASANQSSNLPKICIKYRKHGSSSFSHTFNSDLPLLNNQQYDYGLFSMRKLQVQYVHVMSIQKPICCKQHELNLIWINVNGLNSIKKGQTINSLLDEFEQSKYDCLMVQGPLLGCEQSISQGE